VVYHLRIVSVNEIKQDSKRLGVSVDVDGEVALMRHRSFSPDWHRPEESTDSQELNRVDVFTYLDPFR